MGRNRWFLGGLIALAAVIAATPYIFGWMARHNIEQMVERSNISDQFAIRVDRYDLGWRESAVSLSFDFPLLREQLEQAQGDEAAAEFLKALSRLSYELEVLHGPLVEYDGKTRLGAAVVSSDLDMANLLSKYDVQIDGPALLESAMLFKLSGEGVGYSRLAPFDATVGTGDLAARMTFGGFTSSSVGDYSEDPITMAFDGTIGEITIASPQGSVSAGAMELSGEYAFSTATMPTGRTRIVLEAISVTPETPAAPAAEARDIILASTSAVEDGMLRGETEMSVGALSLNGAHQGSGRVSVAMGNISLDAYREFIRVAMALEPRQPDQPPQMPPEMVETLLDLFRGSPYYRVEADVEMPAGDINANAEIWIDGTAVDNWRGIEDAAVYFGLKSDMSIPKGLSGPLFTLIARSSQEEQLASLPDDAARAQAVAQMAAAMRAQALQNGWLQEEDGTYRTTVAKEPGGPILINGRVFAPPPSQ